MDFLTQQQQVLRQRKLADMLRAQAEQNPGYEQNPGRMVSGHYVAPSWSQNLAGVVSPIMQRRYAMQQEALAAQQEQGYGTAVNQARQQWQSGLPRTIAGRAEMAGPQAEGGSPELAAVPNQLPNRETILKHTLAGMEIPGNEKAAALWNSGMGDEWQREDKQAELAQMQEARLAQAKTLQLERLQQQEKELRLRIEQNERENVRDNETRRMHQQTLATIAAMKQGTGSTDKPKDLSKDLVKLSTRMEKVTPVINAISQIDELVKEYKGGDIPGFGYVGLIPGGARSALQETGMLDKNTNINRSKASRLINTIVKQEAGLSQTVSEAARQIEANLSSGAYSQKDFLAAVQDLRQQINNDLVNITAGTDPAVVEEYKARGGRLAIPPAPVFEKSAARSALPNATRVTPGVVLPQNPQTKRLRYNPATGELE